jgi:hypothetical protein
MHWSLFHYEIIVQQQTVDFKYIGRPANCDNKAEKATITCNSPYAGVM